jgi:succinylglutamate desuccinylase
MHGNEPAGVRALERVAARLAEGRGPLRGRLAALVGNLAALERAERFVDRDLNRGWLTVPQAGRVAEDLEQQELKAALDPSSTPLPMASSSSTCTRPRAAAPPSP